MKNRIAVVFVALLAILAGVVLIAAAPSGPAARAAELPGMCNGRADPNLVVTAHANGRPDSVPKYILNVSTDASAVATGSLILFRGADHLQVTDWCRVWQHQAGQPSGGECETTYPEGATTAHAVGLSTSDGQTLLVRTDVRRLSDGDMFFRVRYRTWSGHEEAAAPAEEAGCEDEGWTRVPAEGWYPLDQMRVRVVTPTT